MSKSTTSKKSVTPPKTTKTTSSKTPARHTFHTLLPKICFWGIIGLTFVILSWILFLRINDGFLFTNSKALLLIFLTLCVVATIYAYHRHHPIQLFQNPKFWRVALIFSVVIGVSLRLLFLSFADEFNPNGLASDTGVHYNAAQEILDTGVITSSEIGIYEAYHTQLTSYTLVTTLAQWFFGPTYLSVLIPNIIFDLVAALAIFILLKNWQNSRIATIGVALYLLNPLGITFCAQALALSIVNMFIALTLLLIYYFWQAYQKGKYKNFLILTAATGIVLALGNALRPVFSVFLIAIAIFLIVIAIRKLKKRPALYALGGLVLAFITFTTSGTLIDRSYQLVNPYYQDVGHSALGWNLFVGANYDSKGRWSFDDWELMPPRLFGDKTPTEINSEFTDLAIQRYKNMGIRQLAVHFLNKTSMLFARNEVTLIRNLEEQFTTVDGSENWYWVLNNSALLTLTFLAALAFTFFLRIIQQHKSRPDFFVFFLALVFCGLFASSLLVEVMSRYVSIFVVLLIIFSACAFQQQQPQPKQVK